MTCAVCSRPDRPAIDAALLAGRSLRAIAREHGLPRFQALSDHLRCMGSPTIVRAAPAPRGGPSGPEVGRPPIAEGEPPAKGKPGPVASEPTGQGADARPDTADTRPNKGGQVSEFIARALPAFGSYQTAVAASLELISHAKWRPHHVEAIAQRFGLSRASARNAHNEATRHLQLDMGDYLARQAVSAAWVTRERDAANAQSAQAKEHADRWRRQEREAQEHADKLIGKERIAALDTAARFGFLAAKYDLSAEKWSACALHHQRHLDDVLCLLSPKVIATGNIGDPAMFERFAAALAQRFADRPDILRSLDEAAAQIEQGDAGTIVTTGKAV